MNLPFSLKREDFRWAGLCSVGTVALTTLPFLYAWFLNTPDKQFLGLLTNPLDGNTYLAKMLAGAQGEWLFHLSFTSEDHQGALLFLFYTLLGKATALFGAPMIAGFQAARVVAGLFFLLCAYVFVAAFFSDLRLRRYCFLLICLSSGLGWLTVATGMIAVDLAVPEANSFYSLLANPHFPFSTGLTLLVFLSSLKVLQKRTFSTVAVASILSLVMSLIQPFLVFSTAAILAAYLIRRAWTDYHKALGDALALILAFAPAVAFAGYTYYAASSQPVLRDWTAQNVTLSPDPLNYLLGYGLLAPLALAGLWVTESRRTSFLPAQPNASASVVFDPRFLTTWLAVNAVLLYIPFSLQRRFSQGLHIPLAILAAIGLVQIVLPALRKRGFGGRGIRRVAGALMIVLFASNLMILVSLSADSTARRLPFFLPTDDFTALAWLNEHSSPRDTVLASPLIGNVIPGRAGNRVFLGHPMETIHAEEKGREVRTFFKAGTSDQFRRDLLSANGIVYLFYGPSERDLGGFNPDSAGYLKLVFRVGQVSLYRFLPG